MQFVWFNASECHDICLDLKSVQTHLVHYGINKANKANRYGPAGSP